MLDRLERIASLEEELRRELAALAPEAAEWARLDGDARARRAAEELRRRLPSP